MFNHSAHFTPTSDSGFGCRHTSRLHLLHKLPCASPLRPCPPFAENKNKKIYLQFAIVYRWTREVGGSGQWLAGPINTPPFFAVTSPSFSTLYPSSSPPSSSPSPCSKVMKASSQVPLTLAWALSIHKSQGQTLSYVRINMKNMFAAGESYSYFTCSLD